MRVQRLAVIGFGNLGKACAKAIMLDQQAVLAGFVRRPESVAKPLPAPFEKFTVASHISELNQVDAALICVPTTRVLGVAHDLIQAGIPVVECATLHDEEYQKHKRELDRLAVRHKVSVVVGAGWDPGALSLFRSLFALLTPKGDTEVTRRPGVNLHHTTAASAIPGVREALSTELRTSSGNMQRYVYVELDEGAEPEQIERMILSDPLFLDTESLVFQVDSVARLEEEGHGILMERYGTAAGHEHQLLLLEGRFDESALSAQVMLAAARALATRGSRAYSLADLPLAALWGELRAEVEQVWT